MAGAGDSSVHVSLSAPRSIGSAGIQPGEVISGVPAIRVHSAVQRYGSLGELRPPVIESHTYPAPRINVFSNVTGQDVTLSCRERGFPRVGKQTEPLRRNADGTRDLPKTADVADLPATRQDLGDIRAVNAQPVRKLRLCQALLFHERRQDDASVRTVPRPGLFCAPRHDGLACPCWGAQTSSVSSSSRLPLRYKRPRSTALAMACLTWRPLPRIFGTCEQTTALGRCPRVWLSSARGAIVLKYHVKTAEEVCDPCIFRELVSRTT